MLRLQWTGDAMRRPYHVFMVTIGIVALSMSVAPASAPVEHQSRELPLQPAERQAIASLLAIEDARAPSPAHVAELVNALRLDVRVSRYAVRALGRLERPALVDILIPQLLSQAAFIRIEAAIAIGQALAGDDPNKSAWLVKAIDAMTALLNRETDFWVRGTICATLGRLPFHTVARHRDIERLLVANTRLLQAHTGAPGYDDFIPGMVGAARGLEALVRVHQKSAAPEAATLQRLRQIVAEGLPRPIGLPTRPIDNPEHIGMTRAEWMRQDAAGRQRARYYAMLALVAARATDAPTIKAAREDGATELRRLALTAISETEGFDGGDELIAELAQDPTDEVRYEAIRVYGPRRAATECRLLFDGLEDRSPHVTLLAIDLMDGRCPPDDTVRHLTGLVESLSAVGGLRDDGPAKEAPRPMPRWNSGSRLRKAGTWHRAAHAIVSLAKASPDLARKHLPDFVAHEIWQVRMYAARAAAVLNDGETLATLAEDKHDNVREAAIPPLSRVRGHEADERYLAALERPDYQLIRTASAALEGTPLRERTAKVLLGALERLTKARRDTSRDPRVSLMQRLAEVGGPEHATALRDYLIDFDPRIATMAAELLTKWTSDSYVAKPQPLPVPPPPTADELEELEQVRAIVTMRGGARLLFRLFPAEAPLAATRFVRLARTGYYNGLTFHRVAPNFVIQGGSPGANEYMGDGPYMRDEVGPMSHDEGTVGISTRGRDTGDAQIFVNLIHNVRLDYGYTVFAVLERGLYSLHDILEGNAIETIEIRKQ